MRRYSVRLEEIGRDDNGNVTMIRFHNYADNPLAPTIYVAKLGGIFRLNHHLIRATFIDNVPNHLGTFEYIAQGHIVFKTESDWLANQDAMAWAIDAMRRGVIGSDGGSQRH